MLSSSIYLEHKQYVVLTWPATIEHKIKFLEMCYTIKEKLKETESHNKTWVCFWLRPPVMAIWTFLASANLVKWQHPWSRFCYY